MTFFPIFSLAASQTVIPCGVFSRATAVTRLDPFSYAQMYAIPSTNDRRSFWILALEVPASVSDFILVPRI